MSSLSRFGWAIGAVFAIVCSASAQPEAAVSMFAQAARKVEPAVVSIDTKSRVSRSVAKATPAPGDQSDMLEFLRRQMPQRPVRVVGSGFIVDKAGYIVTNAHVIDGSAKITVKLDSGEELAASLVGSDDETDIAVLKVSAKSDLPFVRFGDSEKVQVGDWVLAIGSPFGLDKSVTAGIISQTHRETPLTTSFQRFLQTDAAINRGNSGGPLVNMAGEVVGVNSQIATSTGDYNGVSFALPSREVEQVYRQIVLNGKVRRGYLGILLESVRAEFATVYGLKDGRGAIVTDVREKQGPAALAGIKAGDIIIEFDGQKVASAQDLISRVAMTPPTRAVAINYLRENGDTIESHTTTVKLGERPGGRPASTQDRDSRSLPVDGTDKEPFGLTLVEITPTLASTYKLEGQKGLIVTEIDPTSFIADVKNSAGNEALAEGDLIQRINRATVTDLKSFTDAVTKLKVGDAVVLHVLAYSPAARAPQLKIVQFTVK
ncbi:MAG: trypsin-like peptidase domain-containing protein [Chloracidobacterium sp.]|nr:trypsin-like peptidase domain-containing protein [Chloracidobacterium sp.]